MPIRSYVDKVGFTSEGGLAVRLTNKTGAASIKGTLVHPSPTVSNAFALVPVGEPDIMGIVYEDGIADGSECWLVVNGIAEVYFVNAGGVDREQFARMTMSGDTGAANGYAIGEAAPTAPFATDKHFMEIGHIIEDTAAAGLAKIILHFN